MCEFSFNKPSKLLKMLLQLNCLADVRSQNLLGLSIRPFHSFHSTSSLKTEFAIIWLATPTAFLRPFAFRDHLVHDAPVINWHPNCMVLIKYVFFSFSRERFTFFSWPRLALSGAIVQRPCTACQHSEVFQGV